MEESERLHLYEVWPKLPPKIRNAILSLLDVFEDEEGR